MTQHPFSHESFRCWNVLAYTGARINELASVTVDDITEQNSIMIRLSKTKAGIREIPIHPAIKDLVARLVKDAGEGFIVPTNAENKYGNRGDVLGKRFGRLKKSMGFTQGSEVFHSDANTAVAAHNKIAQNITKERSDLTGQVWKHVLEVELKADLAAYVAKRAGLMAAITKLSAQIQEAGTSKLTVAKDIKALEKSATSIEPTIDGINALLKSFGFRSFALTKADDGPFYKLVRSNGSDAKESLSEGERSFSSPSSISIICSKAARTRAA